MQEERPCPQHAGMHAYPYGDAVIHATADDHVRVVLGPVYGEHLARGGHKGHGRLGRCIRDAPRAYTRMCTPARTSSSGARARPGQGSSSGGAPAMSNTRIVMSCEHDTIVPWCRGCQTALYTQLAWSRYVTSADGREGCQTWCPPCASQR